MKSIYRKILSLRTHGAWPASGARPVALGKDAKVVITGAAGSVWGVRSGTITPRAQDHEVGDTEDAIYNLAPVGVGATGSTAPPFGGLAAGAQQQVPTTTQGTTWAFEAHQPGRMVCDVSLTAFLPMDEIPQAAALNIMAGQYLYGVMIFLKGKASSLPTFPDPNAWNFVYLLCTESPHRFDINQPTEITLTAKSTGVFVGPSA